MAGADFGARRYVRAGTHAPNVGGQTCAPHARVMRRTAVGHTVGRAPREATRRSASNLSCALQEAKKERPSRGNLGRLVLVTYDITIQILN